VGRFANRHAEPLTVTYLFPLPHDGTVSGFAFRLGKRRVVGEVDSLEAARGRFEEAGLDGRTAALIEQERGSVFTQSVGNVPPGEEVAVEIQIDQRLAWTGGPMTVAGLLYRPTTTSMPAKSSAICLRETRPTRSVRSERASVTSCDTFATESFGRPVLRAFRRTLPGASAHSSLLVSGTHTAVAIRLRLNGSP